MTALAPAHNTKPKRTRPGAVPKCAACGRKLRKARYVLTGDGLAYTSLDMHVFMRGRAGKIAGDGSPLTSDALDPSRGDYGDNLVCGQRCGHALAVRLVLSVPGVLDLLPEAWRKR